jgi:hypothetical protein
MRLQKGQISLRVWFLGQVDDGAEPETVEEGMVAAVRIPASIDASTDHGKVEWWDEDHSVDVLAGGLGILRGHGDAADWLSVNRESVSSRLAGSVNQGPPRRWEGKSG